MERIRLYQIALICIVVDQLLFGTVTDIYVTMGFTVTAIAVDFVNY